ncbi:winged helix-turn-helix transcriptional regulator [Halobacterium salinarum]|uniref:winged helix-turn-helix transcriptional regulator n=1 Tax=Halobacterium salinarum TaxID=2242 RepID=UPI001F2A2769|nr:winged helix-turn-helix transcriptional regulator [Halobacterium salinarum]MCF2206807.1 winged helix-turn-helix transcriptional regulator [Halobacterium salinarum]MCF2241236.1 winged helix-turn-helix transcriptional regulator [Halobacterium salinarum]
MGVDEDKRATLRRFAAVGAAGPLARLAGGDSNDDDGASGSDVRDAITGYLARTPGAHFSKLRDDLQLGTGETQHHLRRLCADGVVESVRDGEYKRFYPAGRFSAFERRALGYLRRETPRGMIRELLSNPDASAGAVADALDVSPATVSKYGAELEAAGVLSRADGYEIQEPETLVVLLVRYADSFDAATVAFASEAASMVSYDP